MSDANYLLLLAAETALRVRVPSVGRLMVSDKRPGSFVTIGSAFLVEYKNSVHLVTAYHVVESLKRCLLSELSDGTLTVRFGSVSFLLSKVRFHVSVRFDVATAIFDVNSSVISRRRYGELNLEGATETAFIERMVQSVPNLSDPLPEEGILAGLIGFPWTQNRFHPQASSKNHPTLRVFILESQRSEASLSVPRELTFSFQHKALQSRKRPGLKFIAPKLQGMSGGPVYWLALENDGLVTKLGGVAINHQKDRQLLGASSVQNLVEHLESIA